VDGVASSVTAARPGGAHARAPRSSRLATQAPRQKTALLVALVWCLTAASPALAQDTPYPIFTADHLDATMKTLGPNLAGLQAALREGDFSAAKERAIRSREQLATTVTFWRDHERDDAVQLIRDVLDQFDALDGFLSTPEVDSAGVEPLLSGIQRGCQACHGVYREQDAVTGDYRLNQGAL